jgi:hypothetical protein
VSVGPEGDQLAEETLIVLKNWQDSVRPPTWLRLWGSNLGYQWIVPFFDLLVLATWVVSSDEKGIRRLLRNQATALLSDGLEPAEHGAALELILKSTFLLGSSPPVPVRCG